MWVGARITVTAYRIFNIAVMYFIFRIWGVSRFRKVFWLEGWGSGSQQASGLEKLKLTEKESK